MDRGGVGASGRAVSRRHAQESGLGRAQGRSFTESRTCAAAAAPPPFHPPYARSFAPSFVRTTRGTGSCRRGRRHMRKFLRDVEYFWLNIICCKLDNEPINSDRTLNL